MAGLWQASAKFTDKITPLAPKTNGNSWATDPLGIMPKPYVAPAAAAAAATYDPNAAQQARGQQATIDQSSATAGSAANDLLTGITPPQVKQATASKTLLGA